MIPLLLKLWPALIPLALYIGWLFYMKRRAAHGITTPPELLRGMRRWCVIASVLLLVASFLIVALNQPARRDGRYIPPAFKDGALTPAHSEPEHP